MRERMIKQRTIRLPAVLWDRLDAWADASGAVLNHSEAIRQLLAKALDGEDKAAKRTRKASTKAESA